MEALDSRLAVFVGNIVTTTTADSDVPVASNNDYKLAVCSILGVLCRLLKNAREKRTFQLFKVLGGSTRGHPWPSFGPPCRLLSNRPF